MFPVTPVVLPPAFLLRGTHGCDRHPAFPAPSASRAAKRNAKLRTDDVARVRMCAQTYPRHPRAKAKPLSGDDGLSSTAREPSASSSRRTQGIITTNADCCAVLERRVSFTTQAPAHGSLPAAGTTDVCDAHRRPSKGLCIFCEVQSRVGRIQPSLELAAATSRTAHHALDLVGGVGLAADREQRWGGSEVDGVDHALDLGRDR
ncbi:hypothetical protein ACVMB0_000389 [Bradyrhizobium sp. USDA 4451]